MSKLTELFVVVISVGIFSVLFSYLKETSTMLAIVSLAIVYLMGIGFIFFKKEGKNSFYLLIITVLFIGAVYSLYNY
jgi:membrane associated rhomboid family serine protease